jgi:hypothetical protein
MFSALVDVFFVPVLEVGYGVVSDLSDEGFWYTTHSIFISSNSEGSKKLLMMAGYYRNM